MRIINASEFAVLHLGYAGEKDRTQVRFWYGDVAQEFPGGMVILQVSRPDEDSNYDVRVTTEDGYAVWTVSNYDCEKKGFGECQLIYFTGTTIAKRKVWKTHVDKSIKGGNASVPPTWEDIRADFLNTAGAVQEAIESAQATISQDLIDATAAKDAAELAQQKAETAQGKAEDAKRDAVAAQGYAEAAQGLAESAKTDAVAAKGAAEAAQTAAETAQGKAETAQGKAEDAQEASETAQGKAEDAQTAAETAQGKAEDAQEAAETAQGKAEDAQEAAEIAQGKAEDSQGAAEGSAASASTDALKAEGYAVGKQNGSEVGSGSSYYHDNAAYHAGQASASATTATTKAGEASQSASGASGSANAAASSALVAEGHAIGKQNGTDVGSGSPYYHNSAKYHAEQAASSAQTAQQAASALTEIIDDTAGTGDVTKVWSANKLAGEFSAQSEEIENIKTNAPQDETGEDLLAELLAETLLTESILTVAGAIIDALPSDETANDIKDALSLTADRLSAIYDIWLTEKEAS